MKKNNIIKRISSILTNITDKQALSVIYLFSAISTIRLLLSQEITTTPDTLTYFEAGKIFVSGGIDSLRTPVYPVLCYIAENLVGINHAFEFLFVVHLLTFYFSVYFFFKLNNSLIKSRVITIAITFIYATLPSILMYVMHILTDSLAMSLTILYCFITMKSYVAKKVIYSWLNFALLTLLVFLRPIFIFLIPISFCLWCYVLQKNKKVKTIVANIVLTLLVAIFLFTYSKAYERQYGFFAITIVSSVNQYDILRAANLSDPSLIKNKEMRNDVEKLVKNNTTKEKIWFWDEQELIVKKYGEKALYDYVKTNVQTYSIDYCIACLGHFTGKHLYKSLVAIYILMILSGIWLLVHSLHRRELPPMFTFLWLIAFANIFTAFVGAQAEYARLILPCKPILLLILGIMMDKQIKFLEGINWAICMMKFKSFCLSKYQWEIFLYWFGYNMGN